MFVQQTPDTKNQRHYSYSYVQMGHIISHKHYPSPILNLFDKFGGQKSHRYPTQNKHVPNVQRHHSEQYSKSFLCRSVTDYNKLPYTLKLVDNTTIFIRQLKKYILP